MTHQPREGSIADRAIKFMEAVGGRPIRSSELADEIDAVPTSMSASMGLAVTHGLVVRGMREDGIYYWLTGGKALDAWRRGVDYSGAVAPEAAPAPAAEPAPAPIDAMTMVAVERVTVTEILPAPLSTGPTTTGVVAVGAPAPEPVAAVLDGGTDATEFIVSFRSDKTLEIVDDGERILLDQRKVRVLFQYLDLLACGSAGTNGLVDGLT